MFLKMRQMVRLDRPPLPRDWLSSPRGGIFGGDRGLISRTAAGN